MKNCVNAIKESSIITLDQRSVEQVGYRMKYAKYADTVH